jgi:hypothetical protein
MFGDDAEHFFNTGKFFRGRPGCAVTLFDVKIFGGQVCWHLIIGNSLAQR